MRKVIAIVVVLAALLGVAPGADAARKPAPRKPPPTLVCRDGKSHQIHRHWHHQCIRHVTKARKPVHRKPVHRKPSPEVVCRDWRSLQRAGGDRFRNRQDCVRYVAKGGRVTVPPHQPEPQEPEPAVLIEYTGFWEPFPTLTRRVYAGEHVALALDPDREVGDVSRLLAGLDAGYEGYVRITGDAPSEYRSYEGRLLITEVADTCGAGCGVLGATGIELDPDRVDVLLREYGTFGLFDQVPFYELGRNFWFYGPQLAALDSMVTGFAIANRFITMHEAGLPGAPFQGRLFDEFRTSLLVDHLDRYLANPELTWENTLADRGWSDGWGSADLAAAMMWRIYTDHGPEVYGRLWRAMALAEPSETPRQAAERFVQVAYEVTGTDYSQSLMKDGSLLQR